MKSLAIIALISNASASKVDTNGWTTVDMQGMDHQKQRTESDFSLVQREDSLLQTGEQNEGWTTVSWDGMDTPQKQRLDSDLTLHQRPYELLQTGESQKGWVTVKWDGMDTPQKQRLDSDLSLHQRPYELLQTGESQKGWVTVKWDGMDSPQKQRKDEYIQLEENDINPGWRLVETKGIDQQRPRFDMDLSLVPHEQSLLQTTQDDIPLERSIGLIQTKIEEIRKTDSLRLAQLEASGDPEFQVHHAYNHISPYDEGHNPIHAESDNFSFNHMNHYDEGHFPVTPEQLSNNSDPLALGK